MATDDEKRVYLSTVDTLAFDYHGRGILFSDYSNHFLFVSDLISTQQASHDFLYPEPTNAAISFQRRLLGTLRFFSRVKELQPFILIRIEKYLKMSF